jgi:ribonuclease Z
MSAQPAPTADLSVVFLGTGASTPSPNRGLAATLLRSGGIRVLIDCGEGTQRQLMQSVGLTDLHAIFLTHLHADHWLGLPGMLMSFTLRGRETPLTIYGPAGTKSLVERAMALFGSLGYELVVEDLDAGASVEFSDFSMTSFRTRHHGPSLGYVYREPDRPGRFDAALATELGVQFGPDFGRLQRGETVNGVRPEQVVAPARPGRSIGFTGDTRPCAETVAAVAGVDLLVHESTFSTADADRAAKSGHSTGDQAASIAKQAGVTMLALSHIAARVHGGNLERQARKIFPSTVALRDFDEIEIPLHDRGVPTHRRTDA